MRLKKEGLHLPIFIKIRTQKGGKNEKIEKI